MAIPPDIKARLEQLRQEAAARAEIDRRRALAQQNTEAMAQPVSPWSPTPLKKAEGGLADDSYRGEHTAPGPHFGAPMHDVTRDMYPKDFYGPNGFRYYADYGEQKDRDAYNKVTRVKGKPDEMVYIHRAIPTKVYNEAMKKDAPLKHMIRPGDWVAINKDYAKEHGDSVLQGDYKVASMRVPAKHVWTNGDSVHEWGYHPVESKATGGSVPSMDVMRLAVGGQGETMQKNPFDYENPAHTYNVAGHAIKHKEFNTGPSAQKHMAEMLGTGNWKYLEDPRIQASIKKAGHDSYFVQEKSGKKMHVITKADGGSVQPSLAEMKIALSRGGDPTYLRNIGINEAVDIDPKVYIPPTQSQSSTPAPGGVATPSGMPIGGIDMNKLTPGQQMMPMPQSPQLPDPKQQGALPGQQPNPLPSGFDSKSQQQPAPGNLLQMTPQGRAMSAMSREFPPMPGQTPSNMAKGGSAKAKVSVDTMREALESNPGGKRMLVKAEGPGGVKGIVVPRHMWEGGAKAEGMKHVNEARAKVYGSENREPLSIGKIGAIHKQTLAEHFSKPEDQQRADEKAALERLRAAKHIGKNADTLDESEKLDTVRHEHDEKGRTYVGYASKGTAGHALYTSGHGKNMKHHVINTCPGQTTGCGGGVDEKGIVDTKKGTCFAPNAESQYVNAAVRRAAHEQAKHDPAMTKDWILAHTGSLRNAAERADKKNQVTLFRPNVVDETDVSSRHVIRHLNEQRKAKGLPGIVANSYGKTNELHDPENGYHVTHSNVGPKVKKGREITENIGRDKARVRNTIMAADNRGDFTNEQGKKTPPKGSYMVTDVKRGSKLSKDMEKAITHAKYWSTGRTHDELTDEEKKEGPEAHYNGAGRKTTEEKAHYGHRTVGGMRFDYQRQHVLHPRLVQVGHNDDGSPHMIPTDSRFKDTDYLPKSRFKTKNGKEAGHILMTTPTESTSNLAHETPFTHHVNQSHVEHALKNNGEYEIDKPEDQIKAKGKEYAAPQPIKFMADGGAVEGRHPGLGHDEFHAFPEQNIMAQRHLAMRRGDDEDKPQRKLARKVEIHKDLDTMRLALTRK